MMQTCWKSFQLSLALCVMSLLLPLPVVWAQSHHNALQSLRAQQMANGGVRVTLRFSQQVPKHRRTFTTLHPAAVVFDFKGVENHLRHSHHAINLATVNDATVLKAANRLRMVLNLSKRMSYSTRAQGRQLIITLERRHVTRHTASSLKIQAQHARKPMAQHATVAIHSVDFRRDNAGGGEIVFGVSGDRVGADVAQHSGKLWVTFSDVRIPHHLQRQYHVTDFGTPVQGLTVQQKGDEGVVAIDVKGAYKQMLYQVNHQIIVSIQQADLNDPALARKLPKYSGKKLSLNFQDIKVRAVLQIIADFTGINIVESDAVQGSITLRLHEVPWDEALDIILRTQGLAKRQIGNILLVAPQQEIANQEKKELEALNQVQALAPLHSELVQVNYASAGDIAALIQGDKHSLLSERGKLSFDPRTNTLWVLDTANKLREVRALVKQLDRPVRQVLIEARIVRVNSDYTRDLGVQFGVSHPGKHLSGTFEAANAFAANTPAASIENITDRLNVNLPSAPANSASIGLALAKLGAGYLLDLELSALESEGGGELIASPRLVTANKHPAYIEQGKEVPYQQATSSGATAVEFKKAVLSLEVTPQITPDGKIILKLKVNQDSVDDIQAQVPVINTRQLETEVLVSNGETIVLGGIYERDKQQTVNRVPFIGSLPVVGHLFRQKSQQDKRVELLVFITPKIIKEALAHV